MTDEALALRAQKGDELAMHRILRRYEGLLRFIANQYFIPGGDSADVDQEAHLGAFKAVRDFRLGTGSSFGNFLTLCVRRQIITAVKAANRGKHSALNDAVSLDQHTMDGDEKEDPMVAEIVADQAQPEPFDIIQEREEVATVVRAIRKMTPIEREAVGGIAAGISYDEICEATGAHWKSVDNAVQRGRRKIRAALEAAA